MVLQDPALGLISCTDVPALAYEKRPFPEKKVNSGNEERHNTGACLEWGVEHSKCQIETWSETRNLELTVVLSDLNIEHQTLCTVAYREFLLKPVGGHLSSCS